MAVDAEEAGMDAFMNKPFKLEELAAVYVKILERHNRKQRDISTRQITSTPSTDAISQAVRRSIRNVTPNAKIFVDPSEFDDTSISQLGGASSSLERNGSSPTVAVLESEWKGMMETGQVQPTTGFSTANGMNSGITSNNAKEHAAN